MTTLDVLRILARRRLVVALGVLLTLLVAWRVWVQPGVFSTTVDVYLVPPDGQNVSRQVGDYSAGLVAMAGLVETRVNARSTVIEPTSPDVSITSMGIYDGSTVVLPNTGSQFVLIFDSPKLRVRASGATSEAAADRLEQAVGRVRTELASVQDDESVPQSARVTAEIVPEQPGVAYNAGLPDRAVATTVGLGLGLTVALAVLVDRVLARRRSRTGVRTSPASEVSAP